MKKIKERRRRSRWQVAVLVRCSIPKIGDDQLDLEMWARDVSEEGLKLELTPGLNIARVHDNLKENKEPNHPLRFDDIAFAKGLHVKLQDLFYDDDGSPFIDGEVTWATQNPAKGSWLLGIKLSDKKKQSKAFLSAFKDFLKIVKNPAIAIEKASRRD